MKSFARFQQEYTNIKPIVGSQGSSVIIRQLTCTSKYPQLANEHLLLYEYELHATQQQHTLIEEKFDLLCKTRAQNLIPIRNFYVKESQRTALRVAQQGHYSDTYLRTYYVIVDDDVLAQRYVTAKLNRKINNDWPNSETVTLQEYFDHTVNNPSPSAIPLQVCVFSEI